MAVFFNLHVVHDCFQYAIVLPLWAAAGIGTHEIARRLTNPFGRSATLALLVAGLSFAAYESRLVRHAFQNLRGAEVILFTEKVEAMTPPLAGVIVLGDD